MVPISALEGDLLLDVKSTMWHTVVAADHGGAAEQREVAYLLLEQGFFRESRYWLELAAKQNDADAMQWLAWLAVHQPGQARQHEALGWLARAARHGSVIAQTQVSAMTGG